MSIAPWPVVPAKNRRAPTDPYRGTSIVAVRHFWELSAIMRKLSALMGVVVLFASLGCGESGPPRVHVVGDITYQGKPLPAGVILFEPDVKRGAVDGPQGFAQIKNGKFDTRVGGRIACKGFSLLTIQGYDGVSKDPESPIGSPLFTSYATTAELAGPESPLTIDVPKTP